MADRLLSRKEVSAYLDVPQRTLDAWASSGAGPPYFRVGKHARYRLEDVHLWLQARRVEQRGAR